MKTSFEKFSGWSAILAGLSGFLFSVSFIVLQSDLLSALFLRLGGLFSTAALTALYQHLRGTESGFALLGLLLTLSAALGSAIHGGYAWRTRCIRLPRPTQICRIPSTRAAY